MTDFRPDCIINLHVVGQGKPAKLAWACSLVHAKRGRILLARRFLGLFPREEAEVGALLFGLRQASRLQQEKVSLGATFMASDFLTEKSRRQDSHLGAERAEAKRLWQGFRLTRLDSLDVQEAKDLREYAEGAYRGAGRSR